ncbi:TPA: site-specific DNA-methyltransferase [Haemophilus influenzae]|uniref:site-specific DNA-methyltransferase n=1 Tax=Haemophilus influenzae TaxID=727 RepID=UPI000E582598|nr:site-specific DNA-methyltransferase [Haemophilus influenzae]
MIEITKETLFSSNTQAENEQLSILKRHFPNCFDKQGAFLPEKMAEALQSNGIKTEKESYSLNWLGKSYAKILKDRQPETLLAEDIEHNQKPENQNSENILIQGDNLEVLKHLKHAYKNQIKMIYIDPPYNTGSDGFVYQDDRKFTPQQLVELGMDLEEAERVLEFTAKKSNSHSAWLTFMYPRLYIARELLRDDGVIFISIDDNEQAQLKLLCDEVFGEENFVAELPWKGRGGGADDKNLLQNHEYILMYTKYKEQFTVGRKIKSDEKFPKFDTEKNRFYKTQLARKWGSNSKKQDRPNLFYSITTYDGIEIEPKLPDGSDGCWRWKKGRLETAILNKDIEFQKRDDGEWEAYEKIYQPLEGEFRTQLYAAWLQSEIFEELEELLEKDDARNTAFGTKQFKDLFDGKAYFDYPKPTPLIKILMKIAALNSNQIILDFFAGSGTTAHAVMQLNAEDKGNRKFICVQLPEPTDEKSEAYKAGYKTIFDITKARIEKSAVKIRQDFKETTADLGFKIFKTEPHFQTTLNTDFDPQIDFLPKTDLNDKQLHTLLTTWRVFDGCRLPEKVQNIDLVGYTAYYCRQHLYLLASGFTSDCIKSLIERLDNDKDFVPERIVLFGENIDSAMQKELAQAVKTYANKKGLNNLSVLARY